MKTLFITVSTVVLLTACGGSKADEKAITENAQTAETEVTQAPVKRDWKYYSKKASEFKLDGIAMTNETLNPDTSMHKIYTGWKVTDVATSGCNIIRNNVESIAMSSNVMDLQDYSLEKFAKKNLEQWKSVGPIENASDYSSSNVKCFYFTIKNWKDMGVEKNAIIYEFVDVNADVLITGYLEVFDTKTDLAKTEATLKKVIDYFTK